MTVLAADEVMADTDEPKASAGIGTETVLTPNPVRRAIRPRTAARGH